MKYPKVSDMATLFTFFCLIFIAYIGTCHSSCFTSPGTELPDDMGPGCVYKNGPWEVYVRLGDNDIAMPGCMTCSCSKDFGLHCCSTKGRYTRWPKHCKVLKDAYGCDKLVEKDDEEKPCEGPTSGVLK